MNRLERIKSVADVQGFVANNETTETGTMSNVQVITDGYEGTLCRFKVKTTNFKKLVNGLNGYIRSIINKINHTDFFPTIGDTLESTLERLTNFERCIGDADEIDLMELHHEYPGTLSFLAIFFCNKEASCLEEMIVDIVDDEDDSNTLIEFFKSIVEDSFNKKLVTMKIFEILEREIDKELDKMPKGLSARNKMRFINKALDRIAMSVGREFGIQTPSSKGIKEVFWNCHCNFPSYDDDVYIRVLKGEPFGKPVELAEFEYLESYREEDRRNFANQLLVNNEWGANYDPETKTMLGGYSEDGHQFRPDFRIKELEEDDMPSALTICSLLYPKYGKIDTSYIELQKEFEKSMKDNAENQEEKEKPNPGRSEQGQRG